MRGARLLADFVRRSPDPRQIREIALGVYLGMVFFGKRKLPIRFALSFNTN